MGGEGIDRALLRESNANFSRLLRIFKERLSQDENT